MTLVNITLTEQEQELILAYDPTDHPDSSWRSIADKIRRAQQDVWVMDNLGISPLPEEEQDAMELYQEKTTHPNPRDACGLCGQDKDSHDQPDHNWQWLRPKE